MGYHHVNCGCPWCEGERRDKMLQEIAQSKCNHTYPDGRSAIEYCSTYEMRERDMYCKICGKEGSQDELRKGAV